MAEKLGFTSFRVCKTKVPLQSCWPNGWCPAALQAGMFLWVALGAGVTDADEILDLLAGHRVVVVPGEPRWPCTPRHPMLLVAWWTFMCPSIPSADWPQLWMVA